MRADFSQPTKDTLARRVAFCCSNPKCGMQTIGPHSLNAKSVNIGVAAHIIAASPLGPRYDPKSSAETREDISNGIWLCQSCAKLVDSDIDTYPAELLHSWKKRAETKAGEKLNRQLKIAGTADLLPEGHRPILPNGLYESELEGTKLRYFLKDNLLHTEQEFGPGVICYCVIDDQGNVVDLKLPYPIEEYSVEIPDSLVLDRRTFSQSDGRTREEIRMKWGKSAVILRDKDGKLKDCTIHGGANMDHKAKKFIASMPEARR